MPYHYLESVYNITKNYSPSSDKFVQMLKINDSFIRHFNYSQTGGGDKHIISVDQIKKSQILNNFSWRIQKGGTENKYLDELNVLKNNALKAINDITSKTDPDNEKKIKELVELSKKMSTMFTMLINYIKMVYTHIPDKDNIARLDEQLKHIKEILEKY